jgi:hypothetical protein
VVVRSGGQGSEQREGGAVSFQDRFNFYAPLDHIKSQGPPMADYPQDAGKGALFRNEKREKPSHPEFRGDCTITIDGVERKLWISAWVKTSEKTGKKFFSLAFREAEAPREQRQQKPAGGPSFSDRDTIPFAPETRI